MGRYNCAVGDTLIGSVVAGHRIDRLIGRGGMGVVFEAVELGLDRPVALKVIAPELAGDPAFRERFIAESRVAAALEHPNVLPIFRAGEDDGVLFLAMRLVAGDDLRTLVDRDGPLAPGRAAAIVAQVASALDAAHARRLIHRDVKPANVLVAGEHAYLTDFGLVKDLSATAADTRTGEVLGTLDYVAPERIRGGEPGPWSDIYSLGCLLFFLLTGTVVFPLELPESKLWAHVSEPPPAVSERASGVPAALDDVLRRALAKDPDARYPTASALGEAALQAAAGEDRLRPMAAGPTDEEVERRLDEIRSGPAPGKARRMEAFARELAERRRAQAPVEGVTEAPG